MSTIFTVPKADTFPLIVTVAKATLVNYVAGLNTFHTGTGKLWFYGKYGVNDLDSAAVFKKDLSSGVSVLADGSPTVDGSVQVVLAPADTSSIPVDTPISLFCSLKGTDGSSEYTLSSDVVLVVKAQATSKVS
jgi:hypothetical protein